MSTGPGNQLVAPAGALTYQTLAALLAGPFVALASSQAVPQGATAQGLRIPGKYALTKATAGNYTLKAPVSGADDGTLLEFLNVSGAAHTITGAAAGVIVDGNSSGFNTVFTFNAHKGGVLILEAYQGAWYARSETGGAMSS